MMIAITTSDQKSLLGICIVFAILPTLALGLRVYARHIQKIDLNRSEYFMFAGLIGVYGLVISNLVATLSGGLGEHLGRVTHPQFIIFAKAMLAIQVLWAAALCCIKVSITLFYIQIFSLRRFRVAAYGAMAASVVFATIAVLDPLVICRPLRFNWEPTLPGGTCGDRGTFWLTTGLLNIVTDLFVLSLPIPMVWKLQIPRVNKLALLVIFSLGFFMSVISIVRLKFLLRTDFTGDVTWTVVQANIWSILEPSMAIFTGCLPTLAPLCSRILRPKSKTSTRARAPSSHLMVHGDAPSKKDTKHFHELEDVFPLTSNKITANSTLSREQLKKSEGGEDRDSEDDAIRVVTEWEVNRC